MSEYLPRISTTVVPPDPNEAMVEWSDGDRYRFYIKLPRYIANAIIADHAQARLVERLWDCEHDWQWMIMQAPDAFHWCRLCGAVKTANGFALPLALAEIKQAGAG